MNDEEGHEELATEAEREAEGLEQQGDKLDDEIEAAKADWERKQEDDSVPGAVPDPGESAHEAAD